MLFQSECHPDHPTKQARFSDLFFIRGNQAWNSNSTINFPAKRIFYSSFGRKKKCFCEYPCPCGYYEVIPVLARDSDARKACTCAASTVTKYQKRISGPLLDRTGYPWFVGYRYSHRGAARGL